MHSVTTSETGSTATDTAPDLGSGGIVYGGFCGSMVRGKVLANRHYMRRGVKSAVVSGQMFG